MTEHRAALTIGRILACLLILAVALGISSALRGMRKPPAEVTVTERALRVEALEAVYEDVQVYITGFGEIRARDTVRIASEIAGRITEIHPRLELGEVIPAGELLFKIDRRNYWSRYQEATANVTQLESAVRRLEKQYDIEKGRLHTLIRSRDLAQDEFERIKKLLEDGVSARSSVDRAEMALNTADDAADQLSQTVDLFPIRIQEAEGILASAQAKQELAAADLERTEVRAPFNARIKSVSLEAGQYVSPGMEVLTLADDSILEISVPLNSRDAGTWLVFDESSVVPAKAWFSKLMRVPVEIYWTEDQGSNRWIGELHRVQRFDEQTRTLTVAVRIRGSDVVSSKNGGLPLVEGMFCKVSIPGKVARNVVAVPAEAIGFERDAQGHRNAYLAVQNASGEWRLRSIRVKESHMAGDYLYLREGIEKGDVLITTRLINPLENSLLDITLVSGGDMDS